MLHNVLIGLSFVYKGHDGLHGLDGIPGAKGDQVKTNGPGARFSKVPRTFRARKSIRKITTCLLYKAG